MTKSRKNISLDPDVANAIESSDENFSDLVNRWAHAYFIDDSQLIIERTMLKSLIDRVDEFEDEQKTRLESEADEMREELQTALDRVNGNFEDGSVDIGYKDVSDDELRSVAELLNGIPADPTNPAIHNHAGNLGLTPQELVSMLKSRGYISNGEVSEA